MTITALALHKGIEAVWYDYNLDWEFKKYWAASQRTQFLSFDETEAMAGTPMPYCVFSLEASSTVARMTKGSSGAGRQELHNTPLEFRIYARKLDGVSKSVKQIAGELAEKIIQLYGGHPDVEPKGISLDSGGVVFAQYQTDFGMRLDDGVHKWTVQYTIQTDVPMAA